MFNLGAGDKLEGIAVGTADEVSYHISGVDGTTLIEKSGYLQDAQTDLHDATAATRIYSVVLHNKDSSAITVTLQKDPGDAGTLYIFFSLSLGAGYQLFFDGQRCTVLDASGNIQTMPGLHAPRHLAGGADPITTMITSTNVITDHQVLRGDGGVRGAQETTIIVSDAGEMTNPSQPAFLCQPTQNQTDIAVGEDVLVIWDTERFDQGGNFAANTFTAPVDGRYQINGKVSFSQIDMVSTQIRVRINTSNQVYYFFLFPNLLFSADTGFDLLFSILCDMDAADTVFLDVNQSGGAQQTNISLYSWFSGALIC